MIAALLGAAVLACNPMALLRPKVFLYAAVFSPDGRSIVFSASRRRHCFLFRADIATGAPKRITSATSGCETTPQFSPDGQQLAFVHRGFAQDTQAAIMGANADGTDERILVTDAYNNAAPRFASAVNEVVYLRKMGPAKNQFDVYAVYLPTREIVRLTHGEYSSIYGISVSPDGRRLLLSVDDDHGDNFVVVSIDSAGKPMTRLRPQPFAFVTLATWLPDGRSLLFAGGVRRPGGTHEDFNVYRLMMASGDIVPLTHFSGEFVGLHVSPDGTKAVVLYQKAYYIIDLATHQLTRVPLVISSLAF